MPKDQNNTVQEKIHRTKEYAQIHNWLRKNYGSPRRCESKGCLHESTIFDWALKAGSGHAKRRGNYLRLCRKCHIRYDWNNDKTNRLFKISHGDKSNRLRSKTMRGRSRPEHIGQIARKTHSKEVIKISKNGSRTTYSSLTKAAEENGVTLSAIWLILSGQNKHNKYGEIYVYKNQ